MPDNNPRECRTAEKWLRLYEKARCRGLSHESAVARVRRRYPELPAGVDRWLCVLAGPPTDTPSPGQADYTATPQPLPSNPSLPQLPGYEILDKLGQGGMGVIYRARQLASDRLVALKMLSSGEQASPSERQRFQVEAQAIAALDHPHIVPIYEVGEHQGRPFFSMKLLEGGPVSRDRLGADHLSETQLQRRIATVVESAARAVHHAHQRGVLHRDLKPANLLLDEQGQVYVTDFGLARRLDRDQRLTQSGEVVGTLAYMACEQILPGGEGTWATDVYGLGTVLYELLTGRPPFEDEPLPQLLEKLVQADPPRPRTLRPQIDRDLETICRKCLDKEPTRRYASAAELADDLHRWLQGEAIHARAVGGIERLGRWCRRKPVLAGLLGTIVALVIALVVSSVVGAVTYREAARLADLQRELAEEQSQRVADAEHAARVEAGRDSLRRGNWAEALKHYAVAIANDRPDRTRLEVERLRCWFSYRDRTSLQEELARLCQLSDLPADLICLVQLHRGDTLMSRQGQADQARQLVQAALAGPLPPADAAYARGLLESHSEQAIACFREALRLDTFHHRANSGLACELLLTGRFDETRQVARLLRTLYPTDPVSYFALAWCGLLEGNLPESRAERQLLRPQLDAARWKELEQFFSEMEKVIATIDDWEKGKRDTPWVVVRLSSSATRLLAMNNRALEPIGFSAPAVARLFEVLRLLQQASALHQIGWSGQALALYQQAARLHPEAAVPFLASQIHVERMVGHARARRMAASFEELRQALELARQGADRPTLLPRSPYRLHARMMVMYLETALDLQQANESYSLAAALLGTAGQGTPFNLGSLVWLPRQLAPSLPPSQRLQQLRLIEQEGRQHPQMRRTFTGLLVSILPAAQSRLLLEDWALDEPASPLVWQLRAEVELRDGNPAVALACCDRLVNAGHALDAKMQKLQQQAREQIDRQRSGKSPQGQR